jgi:hypothetical protein
VCDNASSGWISIEVLKQLYMNTYYSTSVHLVGPKDVNIQPEGMACYRFCQISAQDCIGGKHVPSMNGDL